MTSEDLEIRAQTQRLEPVRRSLALIVFGHLVFAGLIWWWVEYRSQTTPEQPDPQKLTWMSPADINASLLPKAIVVDKVEPSPPPPVPTPAPPSSDPAPTPPPQRKVLPKAILVSPAPSAATAPPTPAKTAAGSRFISVSAAADSRFEGMTLVNDAIHNAFLASWISPTGSSIQADQRTVSVDLAISRDGTVHSFRLAEATGDETLRTSVLDAANRLNTISMSLPDDFKGERYSVKVTCYVE